MSGRGRPREIPNRTIEQIHLLRKHYNYGSLRIGKTLGISRETARYYINKGKRAMWQPKVVILTYNKHHLMRKAVDSALRGSVTPEIMVIDNTGKAESLAYLQDIHYPRHSVHSVPMTENMGTTGAWNFALAHYRHEPYVILANDDVEFHHTTIEELVTAAESSDAAIVFGSRASGAPFHLCLIRMEAHAQIGPFDQTFRPIYFDDNDYHWRIRIGGFTEQEVPNATYDHIGTAHLKDIPDAEVQKHHIRFRWNEAYYRLKWGGTPGNEQYVTPFNSGIDSATWHRARAAKGWLLPDKYNISAEAFVTQERYYEV